MNELNPAACCLLALQVFEFVKLAELYYAGSHGMDIKGPAKGSRHTRAAKVPIKTPALLLPERGKKILTPLCLPLCVARRPRASSSSRPASSCP